LKLKLKSGIIMAHIARICFVLKSMHQTKVGRRRRRPLIQRSGATEERIHAMKATEHVWLKLFPAIRRKEAGEQPSIDNGT